MKKKFLCLALCLLMMFASLVGCTEENRAQIMNKIGREASENASTVTMYLISESKVSPTQEALVEAEVNEIMASYDVYLDIKYFTEDEYYKTLETNLDKMLKAAESEKAERESKKKDTSKTTETAAATEEEYLYTNENGQPAIYYPPNPEYHVDIFYFSGYDRYLQYSKAGYLANFSTPITDTNAKAIKNGVSTAFFNGVKTVNSKYDMMPCNTQIGEYTYLLLNKDLLASTQYSASDIGTLMSDNCDDFLKLAKTYPDYVPLYSSEGTIPFEAVKFFGVDANGFESDKFSLLAGSYEYSWKNGVAGQYPTLGLFNNSAANGGVDAKKQIEKLKTYEIEGYYGTEADADKPFAVGYVKGDITAVEQYKDDYEIIVLEKPTLSTEALYENAFAISTYTKQLAKTALVLSEIYTNEKVINLLAHGVEGTNYTWENSTKRDENYEFYRVIKPTKYDEDNKEYTYVMDPDKIGNSALAYPTVNDDPRRVQNILDQNFDASPALTFGFKLYGEAYTPTFKKIAEYSAQAYELIVGAKTQEELAAAFAAIDQILANPEFAEFTSDEAGDIEKAYDTWLDKNKLK